MILTTVIRRLVAHAQTRPLLLPVGRGFSVPVLRRTFPPDGGAFWRQRWFSGLEGYAYAPSTIARKRRKGLPYDRVVLLETGNMYARTSLLPTPDGWKVRVDVPYVKYLAKRYGEAVFKLTGEAASDFRSEILKQTINHYRKWRSAR